MAVGAEVTRPAPTVLVAQVAARLEGRRSVTVAVAASGQHLYSNPGRGYLQLRQSSERSWSVPTGVAQA